MRKYLVYILGFLLTATPLWAAQAPAFDLPGENGPISLKQYRGRVVYLDFWASWCAPCRKSFPWMNAMQQRYGPQGLEVVAINLDKERALARNFIDSMEPVFTIAYDPDGKTAEAYRVRGMPSSYLIGPGGQVVSSHIGFREEDKTELESAIAEVIGAEASQ